MVQPNRYSDHALVVGWGVKLVAACRTFDLVGFGGGDGTTGNEQGHDDGGEDCFEISQFGLLSSYSS